MKTIHYIHRETGKREREEVFGQKAIELVYGDTLLARLLGRPLFLLLIRTALFSRLYGWWQNRSWSRKKIRPFIQTYQVNEEEFALPTSHYRSFNHFFTRQLKKEARPLASTEAVMPADGRYRFYTSIQMDENWEVKGIPLSLAQLLQDSQLAQKYAGGTLIFARLCPTDYHRFHYPLTGQCSAPQLINGWLYSVNPLATTKWPQIFSENKRWISSIHTPHMGRVLFIEVGATCVGSIHHHTPHPHHAQKGEEKGWFAFGGSSLLLLFEPHTLQLEKELAIHANTHLELYCQMGQTLGTEKKRG